MIPRLPSGVFQRGLIGWCVGWTLMIPRLPSGVFQRGLIGWCVGWTLMIPRLPSGVFRRGLIGWCVGWTLIDPPTAVGGIPEGNGVGLNRLDLKDRGIEDVGLIMVTRIAIVFAHKW